MRALPCPRRTEYLQPDEFMSTSEQTQDPDCLLRRVASELASEPGLEAVTIDPARKQVSVATLGRVNDQEIARKIQGALSQAQAGAEDLHCRLLAEGADCQECTHPLGKDERGKLVLVHEKGSLTISRATCPTAPRFWRWRQLSWPKVVPREVEFFEHPEELEEWKSQLLAAGLCGLLGLAGYLLGGHPSASLLAYALAYVAGSWFTVHEVWERLQKGILDVHFLMLAVAAGSAAIGAWGEGAMLLFLFSLSGALEHYAMGRTQREIRALFREAPKTALVLENGHERELPIERLAPGMRLLIKPGSQFPVDAELVEGRTASDESTLTGEATPVDKAVGDTVLAGTLNLWGAVQVQVLRSASESSLQKIVRLIREAQQSKAPSQRFTERFSSVYTYVVLGLSAGMFLVWWLLLGHPPFSATHDTPSAFYRAMTLLVVASPCALVLSIPSAVLAAIAHGARYGILFRGGSAVEKLAQVDTVALDKTGTLTTGELRVERVESFPPGREVEVAQLAFSLERLSTHPLARAITRHGKLSRCATLPVAEFASVTGMGLQGKVSGRLGYLGRREWLTELGQLPNLETLAPKTPGLAEVWVAWGETRGRILLRDDTRPQSRALIEQLRRTGVRSVVLTGDHAAAAEHLQRELGLDDVRSGLKPAEKVAAIRDLERQGRRVCMVGDGVNDAPSIAAASVGVAMGARGSDAALEQADIVLMHDRLENFLAAYRLSQRAQSIIRQNLVISLGTVAVLVTFALLGRIPLTLGVLGHEGSTVIVVLNSLRLLWINLAPPTQDAPGQ